MNYRLAKEIYGTPWCVDSHSFLSLSSILKNIQNGVALDIPEVKLNSFEFLNTKSELRLISREWQLDKKNDFEGIGIINLNGPITKGGGMSSSGMIELSSTMRTLSNDLRIKGFIVLTDSGGGSSSAVKIMSDTINEVKQTKPVYALIDKGGMAGSAAYGIISASTKIFSEDAMNIVGSVGTMISFDGYKSNSESPDGVKHITVYASKSTMKNKAFEEALNNDNYDLLVSELLDPINENFINLVSTNRPQLVGTNFDNGHTVFSKDAIGTFIDGIASFDEVVDMVLSDSKSLENSNININSNSKKMTKESLKNEHPTIFSEIYQEGVQAEQSRVSAWMVHANTDMEAVNAGIASGKEISSTDTQMFLVKQVQKGNLEALKNDSQKEVVVDAATGLDNEDAKSKELTEAFNF